MPVLIRTLSAKDADILARTTMERSVNNGRVHAYGLTWKSHALKTWELEQRQRHKEPLVEVGVNEFDLLQVYVRPKDQSLSYLMADSTKPLYARGLSLFEHERIQAMVKKRHSLSDLARMSDQEMYRLRLEYQVNLSKQSDPVSRRRLEHLKDLLSRRQSSTPSMPVSENTGGWIAPLTSASSAAQPSPPPPAPAITLEPEVRIKALPTYSIPRR